MALKQDIGAACLECSEKCHGFKIHVWRKTCLDCNCSVERHDIFDGSVVSILEELKLANKSYFIPYIESLKLAKKHGISWLPIGLQASDVEHFLTTLPDNMVLKTGEKLRKKKFRHQIPVQDRRLETFFHIGDVTVRQEAEKFLQVRNNRDLSVGRVHRLYVRFKSCSHCQNSILPGHFAVHVDHIASDQMSWHPRCFRCSDCDDILVDYIYCWISNKPYCIRHYSQLLRPRCGTCDELIFTEEYTRAMDQDHHPAHFACKNCDNSLTGHRYIVKEEQPFCIECYEQLYANTCQYCQNKIGCDSKDLSFKDCHWHEKCFVCCECNHSLVDQCFAMQDNELYCSDCYDDKFAARCDACHQVFDVGTEKYEYRGKQWHEQCFICNECLEPIGTSSFIPRDQEFVCVPCYEDKYAQKCTKCTAAIRQGGVTYKGAPYHRQCFRCHHCSKQLAAAKFASRDEKPFCVECYEELFSKKCSKCFMTISDFRESNFISYEERLWHPECFSCDKCNKSLVGKGFLTEADQIICPDCGH